jgi:GntR family transcriptional regulator/MocR family aminotransferase
MELHISLVGRTDLSGEIYRQIRRAVVERRLRPGEALPPSRELARRLGVSRTTVTVAYDRLTGDGLLVSRVGAGTFVSPQAEALPRGARGPRAGGMLRSRAVWDTFAVPTPYARPAEFDFRTGIPDVARFPHDTWRRLLARELRDGASRPGIYAHPAGHPALREAIARHIAVSRSVTASADDVTITGGTQQALDVIARALVAPGDRVAVEDPGYLPPRRLLETLGARIVGVPVDRQGLVVDAIPPRTRLVYVTPSHQYPTGVAMSLARRQALLAWAERNDAAIVEDDYDSEFRYGGRPVEPLETLDATGRVVYVGSFSKTLLPALRLGFLVTPPSIRAAVHKAKFVTDWHTSLLGQAALARFIDEGGFARHLRRMNAVYRERHDRLVRALRQTLADHLEVIPSTTGLHLAAFARRATVEGVQEAVEAAAEAGVAVQPLARLAVQPPGRPGLLLGYGAIDANRIEEGIARLRDCFEEAGGLAGAGVSAGVGNLPSPRS